MILVIVLQNYNLKNEHLLYGLKLNENQTKKLIELVVYISYAQMGAVQNLKIFNRSSR